MKNKGQRHKSGMERKIKTVGQQFTERTGIKDKYIIGQYLKLLKKGINQNDAEDFCSRNASGRINAFEGVNKKTLSEIFKALES